MPRTKLGICLELEAQSLRASSKRREQKKYFMSVEWTKDTKSRNYRSKYKASWRFVIAGTWHLYSSDSPKRDGGRVSELSGEQRETYHQHLMKGSEHRGSSERSLSIKPSAGPGCSVLTTKGLVSHRNQKPPPTAHKGTPLRSGNLSEKPENTHAKELRDLEAAPGNPGEPQESVCLH